MGILKGTTADGKPLFGVVDSEKYESFSEQSSFPWLLVIHIAMERSTEDGLPTDDEELATLDRFETEILAALARATTIHNIGHITGDGSREVYCYLAGPKTPHDVLSEMTRHKQVREFQYSIKEDPAWELAAEWGL